MINSFQFMVMVKMFVTGYLHRIIVLGFTKHLLRENLEKFIILVVETRKITLKLLI